MIEYLPWSKKVLFSTIEKYKKGLIPTLDLELTAKCSGASCIYCDSKPDVCVTGMIGEINFDKIKKVVFDAKNCGLEWVYTCGLGEPLEDSKFWNMIHLFKSLGIKLSMFSNGVFIENQYIARELKENDVHIVLKMDTFNEQNFDIILGKKGVAEKIYNAAEMLLNAGYAKNSCLTDLAFSIVPTSLSIEGIPKVIDYCKKNNIFASIGELEQAGEVINKKLNDKLAIADDSIDNLKQIADDYASGTYMRPICPCILNGIHIDNLGNCIVDKKTGLNCKWFLLTNPQTIILGNIHNESIEDLNKKVIAYRKQCFTNNLEQIEKECNVSYVFGGCGGNPQDIMTLAKQMIL